MPALSGAEHKPVLLVDCELDDERDKRYLRGYFDRITEPKAYVTIPRSNHYANTARALGLNLYDREAADLTVGEIVRWLSQPPSPRIVRPAP